MAKEASERIRATLWSVARVSTGQSLNMKLPKSMAMNGESTHITNRAIKDAKDFVGLPEV